MSYVITSYEHNSDIDWLAKQATSYQSNRLKKNYDKITDYLVCSVIYDPDPIGFSLLQERDCFNGMARVLTRLFFPAPQTKSLMNENYRYSDGLRPEIYTMIDQQVEYGEKLGIADYFFSREDEKPLIMKNIHRGMVKNGYDWHMATEKHLVLPHMAQWICFTGENHLASA